MVFDSFKCNIICIVKGPEVMYKILYLTVSAIGHVYRVYNISIPDSFMYTSYRSCMFQYLTVSCIPVTGHVSIPDSFMYTCYRSCFNTWQFHVYLLQVYISIPDSFVYTSYRSYINTWQFRVYQLQVTYQYLTVSCIPATGHVYDILGMKPDRHW